MTNIFESFSAQILGGKYQEAGRTALTNLPKFEAGVTDAVVRTRQLTRKEDSEVFEKTAICCHLRSGGYVELPLSTASSLKDGDVVKGETIECLALTREGDDRPIFRFDGKRA